MKVWISILILVSACSTTKHGIRIHNRGEADILVGEVEVIVDKALKIYGKPIDLNGLSIHFYSTYFHVAPAGLMPMFSYTSIALKAIHITTFSGCLGYSDLLHHLAFYMLGSHDNAPEVWARVHHMESVMVREPCKPGAALVEEKHRFMLEQELKTRRH